MGGNVTLFYEMFNKSSMAQRKGLKSKTHPAESTPLFVDALNDCLGSQ
jgi:hypothetical protein